MQNAPRLSRPLHRFLWLLGVAVAIAVAFLPPLLGIDVKVATIGLTFCLVLLVPLLALSLWLASWLDRKRQ